MKFYNEDDIKRMTDDEVWAYIDEMRENSAKERKLLSENAPKHFNSVEEGVAYFRSIGAIPFEEWEKSIFEKYGL